jgi:hypothetical protein
MSSYFIIALTHLGEIKLKLAVYKSYALIVSRSLSLRYNEANLRDLDVRKLEIFWNVELWCDVLRDIHFRYFESRRRKRLEPATHSVEETIRELDDVGHGLLLVGWGAVQDDGRDAVSDACKTADRTAGLEACSRARQIAERIL